MLITLYHGQIIIESGNQILSLNATSGGRLWNMDVGTGIHYPTVYQGVLIFGASDSKFYGLDLQSGKCLLQPKLILKTFSPS